MSAEREKLVSGKQAVDWRERSSRADWSIRYTSIGARLVLSDGGAADGSESVHLAANAELLASQVLVGLAGGITLETPPVDADHSRWASTVRRILQRGLNPPPSTLLDSGTPPLPSPESIVATFAAQTRLHQMDPSIELHPTWEVPFWELVAARYPNLAPWIVPQVSLEALLGRPRDDGENRWVDFVFHPPWRESPVVLEIDGSGHERSAAVDAAREKELKAAGVMVYRIPGRQVDDMGAPHWAALDRAAQEHAAILNAVADADSLTPALVHRFAFAITLLAEHGALRTSSPGWNIELVADDTISSSVGWVLNFLLAIDCSLLTSTMPKTIRVNGEAWTRQANEYLPSKDRSKAEPTATIILERFAARHEHLPSATRPTVVIRPAFLPRAAAWWPEQSGPRWNLPTGDVSLVKSGIQRLAHDLFGHPTLRPGQFDAILQVLRGGDSVVLLPTGSGKSLIYQIAGLLRPGLCLIVDPIRALIDDQERRLLAAGIDRVASIHGQRPGGRSEREAVQALIASGDALFSFVTPERLLDRGFREALSQAAHENTINLAVIDEAHCVSEWGHNFRTAFLRLGTNLRRFGQDLNDEPPPLLALTGTASPAVLADTLRELDIDGSQPGALQRPASFDRPNLRYVLLSGVEGGRDTILREALLEQIPHEIGVPPDKLKESSGIIFVPHVSGERGLIDSRVALKSALGLSASEQVGIYGGGVPQTGRGKDRRPIMDIGSWEAQKRATAADFVEGRLPLLVATKAFGMGIDKPDIRFTIHLGYPASIESFAQEAGRAGRDGLPSACVVVGTLPPESEVEAALPKTGVRPSKSDPPNPSWSNDFGVQLRMLNNSFQSCNLEIADAKALFDALLQLGAKGGHYLDLPQRIQLPKRKLNISDRGSDGDDKKGASSQKLLFRLSVIGVVDDLEYVGGNVLRVHFGYFDEIPVGSSPFNIDLATLAFLQRNDPGRLRQHEARIAAAPREVQARVHHHLEVTISAIYDVIYPARLRALEAMHRLVADNLDDAEARDRIVAYLHEGPMAINLQELVTSESIEVDRALRLFDASPPSNDYEWQGAADRMLESYPNHPLVLTVRAIGETRSPQGDPKRFGIYVRELLVHLPGFHLGASQLFALLNWLLRQVRNHPQHDRRGWLEWAWAAISAEDLASTPYIREIVDLVLQNAQRGNFIPEELNAVRAVFADQSMTAIR